MSKKLSVLVEYDSNVQEQAAADDAFVKEKMKEWRFARQQMINQLSALNQAISLTFQAVRHVVSAAGQTIPPIYRAMMGMISGTTSLVLSMATLYVMAGILNPALAIFGVILAAWTLGWSIGETLKLSGLIDQIRKDMSKARMQGPSRMFVGAPF